MIRLQPGGSGVPFPAWAVSRRALVPTHPPNHGYWRPFLRVKRPGRKADQSPPTIAEVKNGWSYKFTPSNPKVQLTFASSFFSVSVPIHKEYVYITIGHGHCPT
jgi:hypothetical protein